MLPDFPLASWEVPPDSGIVLVAPADAKLRAYWRGRKIEYLVRAVVFEDEYQLFLREVGSREAGNWLVELFNAKQRAEVICGSHEEISRSDVRFAPAICSRQFYLEGARYGVAGTRKLIVRERKGEWKSRNNKVEFQLPEWDIDFHRCRAAKMGCLLRNELEFPDSDARFAFDWLHLSLPEKQSLAFGISQEELQQIERLMRYVLHSDKWLERELWSAPAYEQFALSVWSINCPHPWLVSGGQLSSLMVGDEVHVEDYDSYCDDEGEPEYLPPIPPRFVKWRNLFYKHFDLRSDDETARKIFSIGRIESYHAKAIRVTAKMPTAHEKLEAHIALREWFAQVYTPTAFADLMDD